MRGGPPGNAPPICKYKTSREEKCPKKVTSLGSLSVELLVDVLFVCETGVRQNSCAELMAMQWWCHPHLWDKFNDDSWWQWITRAYIGIIEYHAHVFFVGGPRICTLEITMVLIFLRRLTWRNRPAVYTASRIFWLVRLGSHRSWPRFPSWRITSEGSVTCEMAWCGQKFESCACRWEAISCIITYPSTSQHVFGMYFAIDFVD